MAIGNQSTAGQLNSMLARYVSQIDTVMASIATLQAYVVAVGADGLQNLSNPFTAADATDFINAVNYLNTMAALWYGSAGQADPYDFQNQLHSMLGPSPS